MTKSILTLVDETRQKCWWLTKSQLVFFLNLYAHHWLNVARSCIYPSSTPQMARHASDALWLNVMMAEVQALGTGRQIRIDIWTVFNYNLTENKTQCTAITGEKPCGFKIGGKNKRHLKAHKTTLPFMPR